MKQARFAWLVCILCALCLLSSSQTWAKPPRKAAHRKLLKQMWRGTQMERARAIDRLGRERVWRARAPLRKLLAKRRLSMILRVSAILALGRLRDRQSNPMLLRIAAGQYTFMSRISAIWSIVKLQQRASLPTLIRILKQTSSRRLREYSVWAISSFRDRSSAKHLLPMLSYTHDACAAARRVLRRWGVLKKRVSCSNSARRKRRGGKPLPR